MDIKPAPQRSRGVILSSKEQFFSMALANDCKLKHAMLSSFIVLKMEHASLIL